VVTDSGGLQEEASHFGVPAVVLRATTPRWESVATGAVRLTGLDATRAMDAARAFSSPAEIRRIDGLPCPYGSGDTAARVVAALEEAVLLQLLSPAEPDLGRSLPSVHAARSSRPVWAVPA
jgi:UDP-N-acetylglucosamine 2-epimerase (non-hydrolysing)